MALNIIFKSTKSEYEWQIGKNASFTANDISDISYIQGDGDELEKIRLLFCSNPKVHVSDRKYTIPMPNVRCAIWYGDIAKTIIANLF